MAATTVDNISDQDAEALARSGEGRAIREQAGCARAALARPLDVDVGTIFRWETGRTTPRGGAARRYGRLLHQLRTGGGLP